MWPGPHEAHMWRQPTKGYRGRACLVLDEDCKVIIGATFVGADVGEVPAFRYDRNRRRGTDRSAGIQQPVIQSGARSRVTMPRRTSASRVREISTHELRPATRALRPYHQWFGGQPRRLLTKLQRELLIPSSASDPFPLPFRADSISFAVRRGRARHPSYGTRSWCGGVVGFGDAELGA